MTFEILVFSELLRRHGNNKPQHINFLIEHKINDAPGLVNFIFHKMKIYLSLTIDYHFSRWCVSKVFQYSSLKWQSVINVYNSHLKLDKTKISITIGSLMKVSKVAKIRNRYNQVPHLTQDTNAKVTNSQKVILLTCIKRELVLKTNFLVF